MQHVSFSQAAAYTTTSDKANAGAKAFIEASKAWGQRYLDTQSKLRDFMKANSSANAFGFLSSDPLNMSVFGVICDSDPGAGFKRVPNTLSDRLENIGLRGNAYFPDVTHPIGKEVLKIMQLISRAAEDRPLLNSVSGVMPVGIEKGRVVLSRAIEFESGLSVLAAPSAVSAGADLRLVGTENTSNLLAGASDVPLNSKPKVRP
jgi:hypothetical protein